MDPVKGEVENALTWSEILVGSVIEIKIDKLFP